MLGRKLPGDEDGLNGIFAYVKGEVDSIDEQGGTVNVEIKDSNHPDVWSVEGIARALRGYLNIRTHGAPRVSGASKLKVTVDKRLRPIRPYIACAIVKGVKPSEEALKSWINLQDKMDQTYGRKRKKASIGLYQADLVKPPLRYTVSKPEAASFAPLGSESKMSLKEILEKHPKGLEYGHIISPFKEWPLLVDGEGKILSLPPVINSNDLGKVTTETRNILLEVTGTNLETVHNTLKIVVTAMAERGGQIYTCDQFYPYPPAKKTRTPDLSPGTWEVSLSYTNKVLGTSLMATEADKLLKRAGYRVSKKGRDRLRVEVPCYRLDIMHQVDIIEDIAIAMDLNKLRPEWPQIWTPGGLSNETEKLDTAAEVMVGLGYQELLTYSLTSSHSLAERMRLPAPALVELRNPKMSTLTVVRNWLLPSLMEFLSNNTHVDYPQRVFEIGPCAILRDGNGEAETVHKLAAATIHTSAGYTEIRGGLDTLLNSLGISFTLEREGHPSFLEGRSASILLEETPAGIIGEVHPEVIKSWGLSLPVAAFELEMPTR